MTRLEDRLRRGLEDAATRMSETGALADRETAHSSRLAGPAIGLAVMAAVLVVLGGVSWILAMNWFAEPASSSARFPIVETLPEGIEELHASYALSDPSSPVAIRAVLARPTADGFSDILSVSYLEPAPTIEEEANLQINGRPASVLEEGESLSIWWHVGDGAMWVLARGGGFPDARSVAEAVRIERGEDLDASVLDFERIPNGFELIAEPFVTSIAPFPVVTMSAAESIAHRVSIQVVPIPLEQALHGQDSAIRTQVRGKPGYQVESGIIWEEAPGVAVLAGGELPPEKLRAMVHSLRFVDRETWEERYQVTAPGLPSTTSTTDTP